MKKISVMLLITFIMSLLMPLTLVYAATPNDSGFIRIETGETHVLAIRADGTVWAWGRNDGGQLGDGTRIDRYVPTQVLGVYNAIDIAAGRGVSVALISDGTVWGWGNNHAESLGIDNNIIADVYIPLQLDGLYDITAISVRELSFRAWDSNGNLFSNGRLDSLGGISLPGRGRTEIYRISVTDRWGATLGIRHDGTVWHNGIEIPEFRGARDVAMFDGMSGANTAYVILENGDIMALGSNEFGQIGNGFTSRTNSPHRIDGISNVADVSALHDIYVIHNDGTASIMFNRNADVRFSKVPIDNVKQITQTVREVYALKNDGTVWTWPVVWDEPGEIPVPIQAAELSDIVNISATQSTAFAVDSNGNAFAKTEWIRDREVIETESDYSIAFSRVLELKNIQQGYVEWRDLILRTTDNKLLHRHWIYQTNEASELREVYVGGAVKNITVNLASMSSIMVLREDGAVLFALPWSGDNEYIVVENLPFITDIAASFSSFLALGEYGNVWQIRGGPWAGGRAEPIQGLSNIGAIAAGRDFYFAITENGYLYAWGENGEHQLFPSEHYTNAKSWQRVRSSVINMTIGIPYLYSNNTSIRIPVAPVIVDSRTLVPIRAIAETLGADIDWNEDTREVTIIVKGESLTFAISETIAGMDVPAQIMNDITFVPLRFISEFFGADVLWENTAQRITIVK